MLVPSPSAGDAKDPVLGSEKEAGKEGWPRWARVAGPAPWGSGQSAASRDLTPGDSLGGHHAAGTGAGHPGLGEEGRLGSRAAEGPWPRAQQALGPHPSPWTCPPPTPFPLFPLETEGFLVFDPLS